MIHSLFSGQPVGSLPVPRPHDTMVDDLSRHMAMSQASRRLSRGSTGQRSGAAMRVVKPTSANNSPRSSGIMARRKTLMNDGNAQRRRQQALEQASLFYGIEQQQQQQQQQPIKRSSRPVSWHPSTYGQQLQPQLQQPIYPMSAANMYADQQDIYTNYPHRSPMLASHSCNTSPSSAFSPLSLPLQGVDNMQYLPTNDASLAHQSAAYTPMVASRPVQDAYSTPDDASAENMSYTNGWDWNTFIMHGLSSTSPPTPEAFPQAQLSQPAVSEESIPYQVLDESEEEGEILIGMGLYDAPDKYEEDPQLNNYRSTVSSLLGSTFRGFEPKGKGLKLEETWEPPKSNENGSDDEDEEDEEEDDDDSEQDSE
ncbi:hypothetical protein EDB81DRAFT_276721 [Dactylonectria macrodidyma]|uniref:Uncharacterized protein n=1 Tax=Dactylonectria macrodidyma TaxID=307937 RepID=A0A9P9JK49_9HYPO|nr:hypothetical protein EDB81DRAFT_276721 [Dactylonectria macrodidyma]